ncbi:hypothetical protein [Paenibacillus qinlingensis]|uniref:hypothetical protein n=1 Tax=Paenibacillus qinlingensis TaxID=1837343 RepID=UPI001563BB74|nr:hypothetical protein [Paenibacillus qinlingensis]NQX58336.1 hypothetical protein [Paenibacillus qinlingensis]
MAFIRLIVMVLVVEVMITMVVSLGIYFGFAIYPYSLTTLSTTGAAVQTGGFNATIPLYMPSLGDLKVPYTFLRLGTPAWGAAAFLVTATLMAVQSFIRGMYLGALKGMVLNQENISLFAIGRRYFGGMIAWTIFQTVTGALLLFFAAAFFPIGIILMIALIGYSLTPYVIVLENSSFRAALAKAPRILRSHIGSLLSLALLAMICTLVISLFRSMTPPWGYAVPLLAYACMGTLLIGWLMKMLAVNLTISPEQTEVQPSDKIRTRGVVNAFYVLLIPALLITGILTASGKHYSMFDFGSKKQLEGISYVTSFSDVYYASKTKYTAYMWQPEEYSIAMHLPDLSGEQKPDELRGVANITWQMDEEIRTAQGNSTQIDVKPVMHESQLMYRLIKEKAKDGNVYYSSLRGSSSILPGDVEPREPISVQIMVSGDGSQIFVIQYPTRFDISPVFRVSDDGRYLVTGTSPLNPMDFHTYWFTTEQHTDHMFNLLAAKNQLNDTAMFNRAYLALASAMQEGDGHTVVKVLKTMSQSGVDVKAPDWDSQTWTAYLHNQYLGISWDKFLELLTKAGVQGSYELKDLTSLKSDDKIGVFRLDVPFPNDVIPITYTESKADGKLLSIHVMD